MTLKGIDVSEWQGDINFDVLKTAVDFFICKVSEGGGNGYIDKKFVRNKSECRKAGIPLGYYHFARPDLGNTPESEAEFFLNTLGDIKDGEVLFLDFEKPYSDPVTWCKGFLDAVSGKLNGYKPLVYLNQSQVKGYNWKPIIDADYGLWLAAYIKTLPATPWKVVAFQQNSSSGTVAGVAGKVDTDLFFGDKKTLSKYGVAQPTETIETLKDKIAQLELVITNLRKVISTNKTPLSEYSWTERFKSLFS